MPESATSQVKELFVPQSRVDAAKREAGHLAALDINQVLHRVPAYMSSYLCLYWWKNKLQTLMFSTLYEIQLSLCDAVWYRVVLFLVPVRLPVENMSYFITSSDINIKLWLVNAIDLMFCLSSGCKQFVNIILFF